MLSAPKKFEKLLGRSQKKMFMDFWDNNTGIDEFSDGIVNALNSSDDKLFSDLADTGVTLSKDRKKQAPFHVTSDNIEAVGEDRFKFLLSLYTHMEEAEADNFIKGMRQTAASIDSITAYLQDTDFKFIDTANMIEFFIAINQPDFKLNIFNEFFMNRQRLIRNAVFQSIYGKNPLEAMTRAVNKARNRLTTTRDPHLNRAYASLLKDFKLKLNLLSGKRFIDDEAWFLASNILNKTMSYATFSPARSAPRNLILDYEGHNLSIGHTLYDGGTNIGKTVSNIFRGLSFLLRQALGNPEQKDGISSILNIAGWANSIDGMFAGNTLSFEDAFDTQIGTTKVQKGLNYVDSKMNQGLHHLYKWSGNHSLVDLNRARRMVSIQQLFTNVLTHKNYDKWMESLTQVELEQLDYLKSNFDLDETTFDFLKEANKVEVDFNAPALNALGFKSFPPFISKQSILDTPDDIARRYVRKNESPKQFKQRIARGWQGFIYNSTTRKTPTPMIADSINGPLLANIPAWIGFTMRPFLKFADSAHVQMVNWVESMGTAVYGRPTNYIGFDRSLLAWARGLSVYLAYGAAVIWVKDLFDNKKPTDFTKLKNIQRLTAITGFGGYANMAAAQAIGVFPSKTSSTYATTPMGAFLSHLKNISKGAKQGPKELGHSVLNSIPHLNMWYTSGATEYLLNQLLLEPYQLEERYTNLERYGKPYLYE